MGKPHVHAEILKACAEGKNIQLQTIHGDWIDIDPIFPPSFNYRIKPEREYPKTTLTGEELYKIYSGEPGMIADRCIEVANAVIKQHIIEQEAKNA